jgi:hypothetical protein
MKFKTKEEAVKDAREQCSPYVFTMAKVYIRQVGGLWLWGVVVGSPAIPEGAEQITEK